MLHFSTVPTSKPLEFTILPGFFVRGKYLNYYVLCYIIVWANSGLEKWSHHHIITDRRSKAVAKFVGESELNMARWEELSIVLNGDQTRVQGGGLTITQGRGLWTYPAPVSWTKRWEDKSFMCGCGRVQLQPIITPQRCCVFHESCGLSNRIPAWK